MVYVYSRHVDSGIEEFCRLCTSWELAIEVITSFYAADSKSPMKGQYYYFAKERAS